ncbi:hypothetical protein SARC_11759 [Sphaeroforma arctica JP610]|uniref:Alpha 1,4-glycosyltransferase domain-containing protein n=1 Tax=Sphaeroforma arctica JP610 TaxID=667725 RepID=A0A0L0FG19_9EUKA|nr:hypothetical protein SARC_11759 [Sphaeroforma arctica JP610]KNC75722.1 hypothetical protein SARC_11759 [Sphaeroforma arctica JP610]|eukprot:XP_014149624.1 hypothetical protein SARC_11759 [Sphaeroforma arctica JP610]
MRLFTWRQRHIVLACIVLLLLGFIPGLQNIPNSGPVVEEITPIDIDLDRAKLQYLQKANRLNSPLVQYNNTIYGHGEYELESDVPQCRKMFVVWTTDESTWQEFNSVSLESIFRYDACAQVFVYANNLPFDFFQGYNEAGFFLKVIRYDLPSLAKGKAGEKWAKGSSYTYKRSPYYAVHESDFLRVFLLYNYGGTYIDLDHFMLPMSRVLNNHKNMLGAETCQEDNPVCRKCCFVL